MPFTIIPKASVASVATHVVQNHSRQESATLLSDMYGKQMEYMLASLASGDNKATIKFAENIADIVTIAKAHNIHRDMHVARIKAMPYRG
jgi:hypothetical protein